VEFFRKLAALGSDGAPVMLGKNKGLISLLQGASHKVIPQEKNQIIGVHCLAHRLELCFKKAVKSIPLACKLDTLLLNLYYFYHNSPLQRNLLGQSFKARDEKLIIPTRVGGTRWVSHILKAVEHLFRGYGAIVTHLEQVNY
jgi:hypothetical protein